MRRVEQTSFGLLDTTPSSVVRRPSNRLIRVEVRLNYFRTRSCPHGRVREHIRKRIVERADTLGRAGDEGMNGDAENAAIRHAVPVEYVKLPTQRFLVIVRSKLLIEIMVNASRFRQPRRLMREVAFGFKRTRVGSVASCSSNCSSE